MRLKPSGPASKAAPRATTKDRKSIRLWPANGPSAAVREVIEQFNLRQGPGWPLVSRAVTAHLLWATLPAGIVLSQGQWYAPLATTICLVLLARETRALENLVHWFSHNAFDDSGRKLGKASLNDIVGNLLAAAPVGQRVETFRAAHVSEHHRKTFGEADPCRARMQERDDVRSGRLPGLLQTLLRAPRDALDFYQTVGSRPGMIGGWALWQMLAVVLPLVLAFGLPQGLAAYGLILLASQALLVPLRAVAEAGEHDYRPDSDEAILARTFDNLGFGGWLCHPAWDDHHFGHHAAMGAQPWKLKAMTRLMIAADPVLGGLIKVRRYFLDKPRPYASVPPANDNQALPTPGNDNGPHGPTGQRKEGSQ